MKWAASSYNSNTEILTPRACWKGIPVLLQARLLARGCSGGVHLARPMRASWCRTGGLGWGVNGWFFWRQELRGGGAIRAKEHSKRCLETGVVS